VRLLLDSHVLLWWLMDDPRLGTPARTAISQPQGLVHVSTASLWEIEIKVALGKLDLGGADLLAELEDNQFLELPIAGRHAIAAARLPRHHGDPFDRLLAAQAQLEQLTLVTHDRVFADYGATALWT
jgi:PIN domain nuclease of toxin-antitoxin system